MKLRWLALLGILVSAVVYSQNYPVGESLLFSHAPGAYQSDIWLRVAPRDEAASVEMRFAGNDYYLPLRRPLHLTAISGEERRYILDIRVVVDGRVRESTQQNFSIDKRSPPPPVVSAPSGLYLDSVRVGVESTPGARVEYTLDRPMTFAPEDWPGSVLIIEAGEDARQAVLRVRSVDEAGNRSREVVREYNLVPSTSVRDDLEIVSPVEGLFANPQLLYVEAPSRWAVYYSFGDDDPETEGSLYVEPTPIPGGGDIRLRLAARDEDGTWRRSEVRFSQGRDDILSTGSGVYDRDVRAAPPSDRQVRYRLDGPGSSVFSSLDEPLLFSPQRGVFRPIVLRLRDESELVYRYLYLLEGRDPGTVDLDLRQSGDAAILSASARPGTRILYSVDGRQELYTGPVRIPLSRGVEDGELFASAHAVLSSGLRGPVTESTLSYDTAPPAAPTVSLSRVPTGVRLQYEAEGRVLFELGGEVTAESPQLVNGAVLEVPFGMALDTVLFLRAIDSAGNLSAATVSKDISIDRLPPPAPAIEAADGTVTISGRGTLMYRVEPSVSAGDAMSVEGFLSYEGPISLAGAADRRIEYTVSALAVDDSANSSPVVARTVVINRRRPVVPPLSGIADGGIYNLPMLTVAFRDPDPELELYYTVGTEPSIPTLSDTQYTGPFQLEGRRGEEITFTLRVLPYYPHISRSGEVRTFTVTLDLEPPELPEVRGISEIMTAPPLIELVPNDSRDTVFYALGEPDGADAFGPGSRIYGNPFDVSVPSGEERELALDVAVRDAAGNVSRLDEPIRFTVDRKPPPAPGYRVEGEQAETDSLSFGSEVALSLQSDFDVYYETTADGRVPPVPGLASSKFEEPIQLLGIEGAVVQYNVAAVAVDRAGNRSSILEILGLTIDREPPGAPPEPTLRLLDGGASAEAAWDVPSEATLFYQSDPNASFEEYSGVVELVLTDEPVVLSYYLVDQAGNRGPVGETEIALLATPKLPSLTGVDSGGLYGTAVTIAETSDLGVVRYEVAEAPSQPAPVTRFSPPLRESLRLDVAEGRTVEYRIRARRFIGDRVSEPVSVSFTVDRNPPPSPELVGVEEGGYYENEQTVTLAAPEGRVFVAVRRNAAGAALSMDEDLSFEPYSGPIRLGAEEGDLASYTLFAFAEDEAGNRSRPVASWQVFIDREVIYVAPDGEDDGEGSRTAPFATVERALEYAVSSERSTIFLADGYYTVSRPIDVPLTLSLVGGYDPETWQRGPSSRSVLARGSGGTDTLAMFLVSEGESLNISGVEIVEEKGFWEAIIDNAGGAVSLSDSRFVLSGRSVPVRSREGSLRLTGTEIIMSRTSAAVVIDIVEGSAELRGLTVSLEDLVSSFDVIRAIDAEVSVREGSISMQSGWMMRSVAATGGRAVVADLDIAIEGAREGATGISVTEGELSLFDVDLTVSASSYVLGIRQDGGQVQIEGGSIRVRDVHGATGIVARDGTMTITRLEASLGDADQFAYGLSARGSAISIAGATFDISSEGEAFLGVLEHSSLDVVHVSARVGGVPRIAGGFNMTGTGALSITNSILIGPDAGVAVSASPDVRDGGMTASNFSGWSVVRSDGVRRVIDVAGLNRLYRDLVVLGRLKSFAPNTSFSAVELFDEFPSLRAGAPVIDRGTELDFREILDIDGQPIPREGTRRDMGADEYYPAGR